MKPEHANQTPELGRSTQDGRHKMRYIIRHDHTNRMIAWSYSLERARACADSLCAHLIPAHVEVST